MHKAKLIAVTKPVDKSIGNAENLIVHAARVSNPENQHNFDTGHKLLAYCLKHAHWSVFEQASMTVEIQTTRSISAQILRHVSFRFQEFSQRYARVDTNDRHMPSMRMAGSSNRQSSLENDTRTETETAVKASIDLSYEVYDALVDNGVATETAREVLPLCAPTTLYMTGTIRSWIHYLSQRTSEHTQLEHRLVANSVKELFSEQFPIIAGVLEDIENSEVSREGFNAMKVELEALQTKFDAINKIVGNI